MLDEWGEVVDAISPDGAGRVATHGETWSAIARQSIPCGTRVRVVGINGLTLTVSPESLVGADPEGAQ
jgi:membrane protein implicated in regulation of membrane protease activity